MDQKNTELEESKILFEVTSKLNQGKTVSDVLTYLYDSFKIILPYDRIGVTFLDKENKNGS